MFECLGNGSFFFQSMLNTDLLGAGTGTNAGAGMGAEGISMLLANFNVNDPRCRLEFAVQNCYWKNCASEESKNYFNSCRITGRKLAGKSATSLAGATGYRRTMTCDAFLNSPWTGADDPFLLAGLEADETSHFTIDFAVVDDFWFWNWAHQIWTQKKPSKTELCRWMNMRGLSENRLGNVKMTGWLEGLDNKFLEQKLFELVLVLAIWACQFGIFWSRPIGFQL